jgi:hypothetical protein
MGELHLKLPDSDDIFVADSEEVARRAIAEGYIEASQSDVASYDARKKYLQENSAIEREAKGFATGLAAQTLAVPALATQVLTGEEQTGHSWLADFASGMGHMSPEEAEQKLRIIAEEGSSGHFGGTAVGTVLGTKGAGLLGKAGTKALGLATKIGTKTIRAGSTLESVASHISLAKEQAFVQDQQLSTETMMVAAGLGLAGPLLISPALSKTGQVAKKGLSKLDDARLQKFAAAGEQGKPPVRFSDIFHPDRKVRLETAAGAAEEAADSLSAKSFSGAASNAKNRVKRAFVPTVKSGGQGLGGSTSGMGGALLGGLAFDNILGAIGGGLAGKAIQHFGPQAAGFAVNQMSKGMRYLAGKATRSALTRTGKAIAPKDLFFATGRTLARGAYRERVNAFVDDSRSNIDQALSSPEELALKVAGTYGELAHVAPHMLPAITMQYQKAFGYLKSEMPPQPNLHPGLPQLGKMNVPIGDQESFLRKVRAVRNPLTMLQDLESGVLHSDTVEAVRMVYPAMYRDIQTTVLEELQTTDRALTRQQAMSFDKLLGDEGMIYGASNPGFVARLDMASALRGDEQGGGARKAKKAKSGGRDRGSPTFSQQYKTTTQKAVDSIGN